MKRRYAIIGAGNGGLALAAQLLLAGESVALFDLYESVLEPLRSARILKVTGALGEHSLPLASVYSTIAEAVRGADTVVLVTPASAHLDVARSLAPHLKDGQIVLLMPGRTGGALEFQTALLEVGCQANVLIGETQTLPYAVRKTDGNSVRIFAVKRSVPAAALPAARTAELVASFPALAGFLRPATSVLETSLNNIGMIFHPGPTVLNAGRIEDTGGKFDYYHGGITPGVARLLERVDSERCRVGQALSVPVISAVDWLAEVYGVKSSSLWESIHANQAYAGISAPSNLQTRYLMEDVATGLVPLVALAGIAGVDTPYTGALIQLASGLLEVDFARSGRTLARMGLAGINQSTLHSLVGNMAS